jgi:hypothetical protein
MPAAGRSCDRPTSFRFFHDFPRLQNKFRVGTEINLCTPCFIRSPPDVNVKIPINRYSAQLLFAAHKLHNILPYLLPIASPSSLPNALPFLQSPYSRRTSGHSLGNFKTGNFSVFLVKCNVSHCLCSTFSLPSLSLLASSGQSIYWI